MKSSEPSPTKRKKTSSKQDPEVTSEELPHSPTPQEDAASPQQKPSPWRVLGTKTCKKLSPRGEGLIAYEYGINTEVDVEPFGLRIISSGSSGTFSKEWLTLDTLKLFLETHPEKTLKSVIFADVFKKSSNNNHGYLAAILVEEGVLTVVPDTISQFTLAPDGFDHLLERLKAMKINHE